MAQQGIIARIQRHTREEYRQLLVDGLTNVRIWIQEHGEQAAVIGVVAGVFIVLFLKLVIWLVLLAFVAGVAILLIAPESLPPVEEGTAHQTHGERKVDHSSHSSKHATNGEVTGSNGNASDLH